MAVNVAVVLGDAPVDNVPVTLGVGEGVPEYVYPDVKEPVALALTDGATDVAAEDGVIGDTEPDSVVTTEGLVVAEALTGITATEVTAVDGVAVIVSSVDGVALIDSTGGGTVPAADGDMDAVVVLKSLPLGVAVAVRVEAAV